MKVLLIYILPIFSLICIMISYLKGRSESNKKNNEFLRVPQNEYLLTDDFFLNEAFKEAQTGLKEGGIPIGSVIVVDKQIVGRGYNRRIQFNSSIHHGEMNALESMGRQMPEMYRNATLYTTLTPCEMCSGAILFYKIPRVVIGDNINDKILRGGEDNLRRFGVEVIVHNKPEIIAFFSRFKKENPTIWGEASVSSTCQQPINSYKERFNLKSRQEGKGIVYINRKVLKVDKNCNFLFYIVCVIGFFSLIVLLLKIYDAYKLSIESVKNLENYIEI